ncbi:MAG: SusC/RagA family TonB-linked outer membrane protein, partial [Sphingobacteriia bacterium]
MKQVYLFLLCLLLGTSSAWAQKTTFKGKLSDNKGNPLVAATVREKGTNNATKTDDKGNYSLSADAKAILQISAIGYGSKEVPAASAGDVFLTESVDNLNEVVVTALGFKREKKALGYAVQEVKGENLTVAKSIDVSSSIVGKVAGVQLVGSPSSTFDNANILIRGVTGLGPVAPIFVVDGTITDQSAVLMDNVENLSVLK